MGRHEASLARESRARDGDDQLLREVGRQIRHRRRVIYPRTHGLSPRRDSTGTRRDQGKRLTMDQQTYALAETLWNYHLMKHQIAQADAILVLCSHDERVAERAAQLFHEEWAALVIFSGGQGSITRTLWDEPEAERFARIAAGLGVPLESMLIEARSTNTGENIEFTKRLLAEHDLDPKKFIVV